MGEQHLGRSCSSPSANVGVVCPAHSSPRDFASDHSNFRYATKSRSQQQEFAPHSWTSLLERHDENNFRGLFSYFHVGYHGSFQSEARGYMGTLSPSHGDAESRPLSRLPESSLLFFCDSTTT